MQAPNALDGELNPAALLVTFTNANETFTGTGNINADPRFVDPVAGNFRLSAGSPSVNAGNTTAPLDSDGSRADQGYYDNGVPATLAASQSLSGTIAVDTVLSPQGGPYTVTANVTVAAGTTLFILPGTSVFFSNGTSLTINGRLVAEGTELEQIRFTRIPVAGSTATWNGIQFVNTTQDNRITWAVHEHARTLSGGIGLSNARATLDHVTFDKNDRRRIESNNSTLIVRNSRFETIFAPGRADQRQPERAHPRRRRARGRAGAHREQLLRPHHRPQRRGRL